MQVWELIVASGIIGLIFSFCQQLTMWKLNRKAAKEDQAELHIEERIKSLEEKVDRLSIGQKSILHDRIKWWAWAMWRRTVSISMTGAT